MRRIGGEKVLCFVFMTNRILIYEFSGLQCFINIWLIGYLEISKRKIIFLLYSVNSILVYYKKPKPIVL